MLMPMTERIENEETQERMRISYEETQERIKIPVIGANDQLKLDIDERIIDDDKYVEIVSLVTKHKELYMLLEKVKYIIDKLNKKLERSNMERDELRFILKNKNIEIENLKKEVTYFSREYRKNEACRITIAKLEQILKQKNE